MRELADSVRIEDFIDRFGQASRADGAVYLTGGASAVIFGWRQSTLDIDLKLIPDNDELLREIPRLKEALGLNLELASPADFIPVPDGWEERSPFIRSAGKLRFHHFDPVSQALSKAERGHALDRTDIAEMIGRGIVEPVAALAQFEQIEPLLYRYPAIDPDSFRASVEEIFGSGSAGGVRA